MRQRYFLYNPLLNIPRLVTEIDTNLKQLPAVLLERLCIAFLVNLRHGLLGGAVQDVYKRQI